MSQFASAPGVAPEPRNPVNPQTDSAAIGADDSLPKGSQLRQAFGELGAAAGKAATVAWREGTEATVNVARKVAKTTAETAAAAKDVTIDMIRFGLEAITDMPGTPHSPLGKLVDALPIFGATKRYAEASKAYHAAVEQNDKAGLEAARVKCLVALADAHIDILTLGGGTVLRGVGSTLSNLMGGAYITRAARVLGAAGIDPIELIAKQVASSERGQKLADYLMQHLKPYPINGEAAVAAPAAS